MPVLESLYRRKTLVCMIFAGLCILGVISYRSLLLELFPDAELPLLIININSRLEVDPGFMETQGVIPLEGAATGLTGVENMNSFAEPKRGTIYLYFNQNTNMKFAYLRLQEKVKERLSSLPQEFTVQVSKVNTDQVLTQFMALQVRGSGGAERIRQITDREIVPEFENLNGVAGVSASGGKQKSVEIILNQAACQAYGITASRIQTLLRQNNQTRDYVGDIRDSSSRQFVNVVAEFINVADLENIVVRKNGPLLLRDIAQVHYGFKEPTSLSRVNGMEAVTLGIVRDAQANVIHLSAAVKKTMEALNQRLKSENVEIVIQSNEADALEKNLNSILQAALIGGFLAVWILWVFLRNLRLVLLIALAIPISILGAFNLFYVFGITLNSLTLVGMTLAVGMLVDSSVVVLENIYRLSALGLPPARAVTQGVGEVWRSIFASTLTTLAVFLPFLFATDFQVRLIGRHVGISIVSTLLFSLISALLLIPMASLYILEKSSQRKQVLFQKMRAKNKVMVLYRLFLKTAMRYPARTLVGALLLFLASLGLCLSFSQETPKEIQTTELNLYLTMANGTTLEMTDHAAADLEKRLENIPEVQDVICKIYEGDASIALKFKENYIKNRSLADIRTDVQKRISAFNLGSVSLNVPAASSRSRGASGGSNSSARLQRMLGVGSSSEKVVVKGNDFDKMENVASDIQYQLQNITSVQSVQVNVPGPRPEVHLDFDTPLMREYDVTLSAVSSELSGFQRQFASGMTFKQGTDEYEIVIRTDSSLGGGNSNKTIDDLRRLPIASSSGADHELRELSKIRIASGPSNVNRVNQERQIEVTYRFAQEVTDSKDLLRSSRQEVDAAVNALTFPAGVAVEVVHQEDSLSEFYFLITAALLIIYMILASVFESFSAPFVMMFSIPLAAIGSFLLLLFTGNPLANANTLMGFLILLGVVINNGIILIDYVRILRRRGNRIGRALLMANQSRIRPIFITAITTIVGMIPLALGKAEDVSNIGASFAVTVIGGLGLSTLLTLVFIPTFYSSLESALKWLAQLSWKIKGVQIVALIASVFIIYTTVDTLLWQLADFLAVVLAIPGLIFFMGKSLKKAKSETISVKEAVSIHIRNVRKIYDLPGRFIREWNRSVWKDEKNQSENKQKWGDLLWEIPLIVFSVYFVFVYLDSLFWAFLLAHPLYFFLLYLRKKYNLNLYHIPNLTPSSRLRAGPALSHTERGQDGKGALIKENPFPVQLPLPSGEGWGEVKEWLPPLEKILIWGLPGLFLVTFVWRWQAAGLCIFIGFFWYACLAMYATARFLEQNPQINILRLPGRFSIVRSRFFRFVLWMPLLGKKHKPFQALVGINLHIDHGMFGLLGPNGAGKSTLMRIIAGVYDQTYGKVYINQHDTAEVREELQGLIGYLPQEFGTYPNMTAFEYLDYQAILKGLLDKVYREKMIDTVLKTVHMEEHKGEKIGSFSGGMKQRIGIAQILLHLPRILIVDEPTAGLDPRERIRFRNLLVELSQERIVIFSTHIIEDISSSCNQLAVLYKGHLRYQGKPSDMTREAEGHVWQMQVNKVEYESVQKNLKIVHHIGDGENIRLRCISAQKPHPLALEVRPTLEDAYLWLLGER